MRLLVVSALLSGCGWIGPDEFLARFDRDGDGHDALQYGGDDCDDTAPDTHPGAQERCDGQDDDCNGVRDDVAAGTGTPFWTDGDADGYGDPESETWACQQPVGTADNALDCDDTTDAVSPVAGEVCNGIDDDCDGDVDDDDDDLPEAIWWADGDGDGWGDPSAAIQTAGCEPPDGYAASGAGAADCDDRDPGVHPDADEVCDGKDADCDGLTDDQDPDAPKETFWVDGDRDGYGDPGAALQACVEPRGYVDNADDCDDTDREIRPGAVEHCDDVDEDCDGEADDSAIDVTFWYADADADGFGDTATSAAACDPPSGYVGDDSDCDDTDDGVYPGAPEACGASIDANCDGFAGDSDNDGDGWAACEECDDGDPAVSPDATEVCNGVDDDCDGDLDDADSSVDYTGEPDWYEDLDGDGYGDPSSGRAWCAVPAGWTSEGGDCDDSEVHAAPDRLERCNDGLDNDCDGRTDDCALPLADTDGIRRGVFAGDEAGAALASAGDLDADGYDDLVIGAPGASTGTGAVYVVYGPVTGDAALSTADAVWAGSVSGGGAGSAVVGLGDTDGDGYDDIGVGAPAADEVYIVLGAPAASGSLGSADVVIANGESCSFGRSLAVGDYDGLRPDLAIGGPTWSTLLANDRGGAWLFTGALGGTASLDEGDAEVEVIGRGAGDDLGIAVALSDIDGDGLDEWLIGGTDTGLLTASGVVYLFDDGASGSLDQDDADLELAAAGSGDDAGAALAGLGDWDGDGYDDVLVGAPSEGEAYLVLGPLTTDIDLAIDTELTVYGASGAGTSVAFLGDIDGDGGDELAIGAPGANLAAVFWSDLGSSGTIAVADADLSLTGESSGAAAGASVAGGDVDGDATADILVGSPSNGTSRGAAYVLYATGF